MSDNCYFSGCNQYAIFGCSCSENILICDSHLLDHFSSRGKHKLLRKLIKTYDHEKISLLDRLAKRKKLLSENIKTLKVYTSQIIDKITVESNKSIKKIVNQYELLNQNLKIIMSRSLENFGNFERSLFSESSIGESWVTLDSKAISNLIIDKYIKKIFKLELNELPDNDDDFAILFDISAKNNVQLIDLNTFVKQNLDFNHIDNAYGCMCSKVNDGKYFVYGGYNSEYLSSAKLIDIKNKTSVVFPSIHLLAI